MSEQPQQPQPQPPQQGTPSLTNIPVQMNFEDFINGHEVKAVLKHMMNIIINMDIRTAELAGKVAELEEKVEVVHTLKKLLGVPDTEDEPEDASVQE